MAAVLLTKRVEELTVRAYVQVFCLPVGVDAFPTLAFEHLTTHGTLTNSFRRSSVFAAEAVF